MKRSDYAPFLKTLRRIPAEVRLALATREFAMYDGVACLCGRAVREDICAVAGMDFGDEIDPVRFGDGRDGLLFGVVDGCMNRFGGTRREWDAIFHGVTCFDLPFIETAFIETAFTVALAEAVAGK